MTWRSHNIYRCLWYLNMYASYFFKHLPNPFCWNKDEKQAYACFQIYLLDSDSLHGRVGSISNEFAQYIDKYPVKYTVFLFSLLNGQTYLFHCGIFDYKTSYII